MNKIVDLHIHSYFSDGTMTPEQILKEAMEKGVGIIAITDHENLDGTSELLGMKQNYNIQTISGVEMDAIESGINFHILGYGFDVSNEKFKAFVNNNREMLEEVNIKFIEKIQKEFTEITMEDYNQYEYDRFKGGWKALHYFMEKGITDNLYESFKLYSKYDHSYTCVNFPSITEVCAQIHSAGGKAVLAHPGNIIKEECINQFKNRVMKLMELGLDGIECYYPRHSKEVTEACLDICNENELLITCGSDCHGEFENTEIGELSITVDQLNIGVLL